jgi:hypothetical protein
MSGGHYDHAYGRVRDLADNIKRDADGNEYVDTKLVKSRFLLAALMLEVASQMAYECEWFMSGDTGDDTFIQRFDEIDMEELESAMSFYLENKLEEPYDKELEAAMVKIKTIVKNLPRR